MKRWKRTLCTLFEIYCPYSILYSFCYPVSNVLLHHLPRLRMFQSTYLSFKTTIPPKGAQWENMMLISLMASYPNSALTTHSFCIPNAYSSNLSWKGSALSQLGAYYFPIREKVSCKMYRPEVNTTKTFMLCSLNRIPFYVHFIPVSWETAWHVLFGWGFKECKFYSVQLPGPCSPFIQLKDYGMKTEKALCGASEILSLRKAACKKRTNPLCKLVHCNRIKLLLKVSLSNMDYWLLIAVG